MAACRFAGFASCLGRAGTAIPRQSVRTMSCLRKKLAGGSADWRRMILGWTLYCTRNWRRLRECCRRRGHEATVNLGASRG